MSSASNHAYMLNNELAEAVIADPGNLQLSLELAERVKALERERTGLLESLSRARG